MRTGAPVRREGKKMERHICQRFRGAFCTPAVSARILRVPEITAVYSECAESPRTSRADRDPSSRPRRLISRPALWEGGMIRS